MSAGSMVAGARQFTVSTSLVSTILRFPRRAAMNHLLRAMGALIFALSP